MTDGIVHTKVFVTKTGKFRAVISPAEGAHYEVTVGGEEWDKGKGREHTAEILERMRCYIKHLESQLHDAEHEEAPAEVLELEDTADFDVDKHVDQCIRLRSWLADEGHISHEVPKQDMQGHVKCHFCQGSVYYTQSAYNGHVTMNGCYCLSGHVYHE